MDKRHKWTLELCKARALPYKNRKAWELGDPNSYQAARRHGWREECCAHMIARYNEWSIEAIKSEALKYNSKKEWEQGSYGSYQAACYRKCVKEAGSHMKRARQSGYERTILKIIQEQYPGACSKWFGHPIKGQYATHFELDIFVESKNRGIEFNGTYWHSINGLRRGRQKWSEEDIKNYHNIKKQFFNHLDIEYLEIEQSDWKKDREACLQKIWEFLK